MGQYMSQMANAALRLLGVLAAGVLLGCGGGGGGDGSLEGEAAVEASVGVALSTLRAVPQFFLMPMLELEPLGGGAGRRIANGVTEGGTEVGCEGGGTKEIRCNVDARGETTLEITYRGCREGSEDVHTRDGSLSIEALDPELCITGVLRDDLPFSFDLSRFSSVAIDDGGAEISRLTASLRESVVPQPGGCFTPDGSRIVSGTLELEVPASDLDVSLTADDLAFAIASTGSPCEQTIEASGGLEIEDRTSGQGFSETLDEALFRVAEPGNLTLVSFSAQVSNSCIGEVRFASDAPLQIEFADACPTGGGFTVAFSDGNTGAVRFVGDGGVEISFAGDDTPESFASCRDTSLETCSR